MENVSNNNLRKQGKRIEKFLAGKRKSDILCTTYNIAKKLQESYPVRLIRRETINEELGLFIFRLEKSGS